MLKDAPLSALFIYAHDLDRMVSFYRDTLGLEVYFELPGQCAFFRTAGGRRPSIALYAGRKSGPEGRSHWFVMFDVPDLEGTVAALQRAGVECCPIEPVPAGRMGQFADPEGNIIEVHQPDTV